MSPVNSAHSADTRVQCLTFTLAAPVQVGVCDVNALVCGGSRIITHPWLQLLVNGARIAASRDREGAAR